MSQTFVLTWNEERGGWPRDEYDLAVHEILRGGVVPGNWSVGARRDGIAKGDRAFLLRQGRDRGLVGSGSFDTGDIDDGEHWEDPTQRCWYADVTWDRLVPIDDRLPTEKLISEIPEVSWRYMMSSGQRLPDAAAARLEDLWSEHLEPVDAVATMPPEDIGNNPTFREGDVRRVEVNRYERDPKARKACVEHWGYLCRVCDRSLEDRYGPIGRERIHVHHVVDLSTLPEGYEVDPTKDLQPVCPNCHAMLHTVRPALTIEELRDRMRRANASG